MPFLATLENLKVLAGQNRCIQSEKHEIIKAATFIIAGT